MRFNELGPLCDPWQLPQNSAVSSALSALEMKRAIVKKR